MQAPTLIIHGTEDEVIDFSAGLQLYERCPKPVDPLWVEGAGHNDIELYAVYLDRLKSFLEKDLANKWNREGCHGDNSVVLVTPLWGSFWELNDCVTSVMPADCNHDNDVTELVSEFALVWIQRPIYIARYSDWLDSKCTISDFQNWFYWDYHCKIIRH